MENIVNQIFTPIAVHWDVKQNHEALIEQLREELLRERSKNNYLASELTREQKRITDLECCLANIQGRNSQIRANEQSKLDYYQISSYNNKSGIPKVESWQSMASTTDGKFEEYDETPIVGIYSPQLRALKIQKYKNKKRQYHAKVNVSRRFKGRSEVAKVKPRYKGKFIKRQSYV